MIVADKSSVVIVPVNRTRTSVSAQATSHALPMRDMESRPRRARGFEVRPKRWMEEEITATMRQDPASACRPTTDFRSGITGRPEPSRLVRAIGEAIVAQVMLTELEWGGLCHQPCVKKPRDRQDLRSYALYKMSDFAEARFVFEEEEWLG